IVSAHACARLQLDGAALAQLGQLLAPGGLFIAAEPSPNPLWDVVFGRYAGWWQNGHDRLEASPLRSREEWCSDLAATGFAGIGAVALAAGPWPSSVIWGRAQTETEAPEAAPAVSRPISLIAAAGKESTAFQQRLALAGHRISEVDALSFAGVAGTDEPEDDENGEIVVVLVEERSEAVEPATQQIAQLARVAAAAAARHIPLWVVT